MALRENKIYVEEKNYETLLKIKSGHQGPKKTINNVFSSSPLHIDSTEYFVPFFALYPIALPLNTRFHPKMRSLSKGRKVRAPFLQEFSRKRPLVKREHISFCTRTQSAGAEILSIERHIMLKIPLAHLLPPQPLPQPPLTSSTPQITRRKI